MSPTAAGEVRERVPGEVLLPGDAGYDAARSVWNAMVDRRPAMIVRATSAADVAAAVRIGLERAPGITHLRYRVQSTETTKERP